MFTFKQLEAVFWVVDLGGFALAATKLSTTQSAVSKRVRELELFLGEPVFARDERRARLTSKGELIFQLAKELLEHREAAIEQIGGAHQVERRLRIGTTELTSVTWLPTFLQRLRHQYPRLSIEPEIDSSLNLRDKLIADDLDIAIVPSVMSQPRFVSQRIGSVEMNWVCTPSLLPTGERISTQELASLGIITQGSRSVNDLMLEPWLKGQNLTRAKVISCNNMITQISLTMSGLGASCLPSECLRPLIERGTLRIIKTTVTLPQVRYVALHRSNHKGSLLASVVALARDVCDFSALLQTADADKNRYETAKALFNAPVVGLQ